MGILNHVEPASFMFIEKWIFMYDSKPLDISLSRIKYMIKMMSMIDTTRSMAITQQYFSGKILHDGEMDEELKIIVEESKREFMDHLYL